MSRTVTLVFPLKKWKPFYSDRQFATTPTISAFHVIASPVYTLCKIQLQKVTFFGWVSPPGWFHQGSPPVTPLTAIDFTETLVSKMNGYVSNWSNNTTQLTGTRTWSTCISQQWRIQDLQKGGGQGRAPPKKFMERGLFFSGDGYAPSP